MGSFYIGMVIGTVMGFVICALLTANKDNSNRPRPV